MNHKERFLATVERCEIDRLACWLGLPAPSSQKNLFQYFGVKNIDELKLQLDDDIYPVDVPYHCPPANHIACAFDFAKKGSMLKYEERTLTTPGFFEEYSSPCEIDDFPWPNPSEHMSIYECRKAINKAPVDMAVMGVMWSAHFQDTCAAFGMETALVKMMTEPEIFRAVIDKITDFYLKANEIFYEAGKGKLDAVLIGNDFGSQNGLIISPSCLRKFVFPGTKKLIEQAKYYNLKVVHHSCGAIREIIPDLIELGVDVIHPMQPLANGMAPKYLQRDYGNKIAFCGGMDVQQLLVNGTEKDIESEVNNLKEVFLTGLVISPSHEAILPDVPPQNIKVMFNAIQNK